RPGPSRWRPAPGCGRRWTPLAHGLCRRPGTCSARPFSRRPRRSGASGNGGDAMAVEVEVLVRQRLLASPEVSALVGTRIFPVGGRPDEGPEAELPAITYQRVRNRRLTSHQGSSGASLPLVQLSCWAETWSEARAVASAVRRALDGRINYSSDPPIHGVTIEGDLDEYDADAKVYHVPLSVRVRAGE